MLPKSSMETKVSLERQAVPVDEDPPFLILIAGDFSGRANLLKSTDAALTTPRPIEIDRDNFDDVLRKLNVGLRIKAGDSGVLPLSFRELDDFHPDSIFRQIPLFEELRDTRKRLLDPKTFDSAAREVRDWVEGGDSQPVPEPEPEPAEDRAFQTGGLLEDILGSTKRDAASYPAQTADRSELSAFVRELVRPYLITTDEAEQAKLVSVVDSVTSDLMRKVIHDPAFKELEAAWRALYLVVRGSETGTDLKIFVYDISKQELEADLKREDLAESDYYSAVARRAEVSADGTPWALICGAFNFSANVDDTATLIRLGKISGLVQAPFISHIRPEILGVRSLESKPTPVDWDLESETQASKLWTMLRTVPEAVNLGLAMPRFLVRLPYGEDTDPTESFSFEELTEEGRHEGYLWANPCFVCALLLARTFSSSGWEFGRRYFLDVEGLPTHVYTSDGVTETKPCAEIAMTHEACDVLIEQGLMPVISFKDTDRVKLGGFQSIAFPAKDLNGRWT